MSALAVLDRTLADSNDRETWLAVHDDVIGSSTAGKFAKPGSVETYIRQILAPREFKGNAATASGNRWEPMLLAWAGAEPNSLLIHHPDEHQFAATVDGTRSDDRRFLIVETKAKHNQVVTGPTPYEIRQIAWQLYCIPEAIEVEWTWGELVVDHHGAIASERLRRTGDEVDWVLRRDPQTLYFPREHPAIVAAQELIVPIAVEVLAGLRAARRLEGAFA